MRTKFNIMILLAIALSANSFALTITGTFEDTLPPPGLNTYIGANSLSGCSWNENYLIMDLKRNTNNDGIAKIWWPVPDVYPVGASAGSMTESWMQFDVKSITGNTMVNLWFGLFNSNGDTDNNPPLTNFAGCAIGGASMKIKVTPMGVNTSSPICTTALRIKHHIFNYNSTTTAIATDIYAIDSDGNVSSSPVWSNSNRVVLSNQTLTTAMDSFGVRNLAANTTVASSFFVDSFYFSTEGEFTGTMPKPSWCHKSQPVATSTIVPDYNQVRFISNIDYLGPDRKEKMDMYLPLHSNLVRSPAVLIIHGGGWAGGDKHEMREQITGTTLVRYGYVCASINYALCDANTPTWPQNIHDCKKAVQFLRKNAESYRIDPNHIGVIGGSAGGHLAAMLGVAGPELGLEPNDGPYVGTPTNVQAVIDMYGITDLASWILSRDVYKYIGCSLQTCPDTWRKASPFFNVTSNDSPFMVIHGTDDSTVPLRQSLVFVDELKKKQVPIEFVKIPGARHFFNIQQYDLCSVVTAFLDKYLKPLK